MSDPSPGGVSRMDELETRIAHQDAMIADLHEVFTAQWRKIEILERQVSRLRGEFEAMGAPREGLEPPPPHY